MKPCYTCKETKPFESFAVNNSRKDGRQGECRLCKHERDKQYYHASPARKRACKRRKYEVRERNRALVFERLSNSCCVDCGETDVMVLEFDHVKGKKLANVAHMIRAAKTEDLLNEMDKCVLRCANCHRRKTFNGSWRSKYIRESSNGKMHRSER